MLPFNDFLQVVRDAPLVSIDLIVENEAGQYLLGLRVNEPAKGDWFVPGGRIYKNETLDQAFTRIARTELGLDLERSQAQLQGVYEHFYETNAGQKDGFGTHYVVLAHKITLKSMDLELPKKDQHGQWRWFTREEIVIDATVNRYSRHYFVANSDPI